MSPDPLGYANHQTPYAYVGADLYDFVDPTGMTAGMVVRGVKFMGDLAKQNPHEALDVIGMVLPLADVVNGVLFASEGDYASTVSSGIAAAPDLDIAAMTLKYSGRTIKAGAAGG